MQLEYMYRNGEPTVRMSLAKPLALNKNYTSDIMEKGFLVLKEQGNYFSIYYIYTHDKFPKEKGGERRSLEQT